jgi:hypothetical protein
MDEAVERKLKRRGQVISAQIRAQVRERAHKACEYRHLHQNDSPLAALYAEDMIERVHDPQPSLYNVSLNSRRPFSPYVFTERGIVTLSKGSASQVSRGFEVSSG